MKLTLALATACALLSAPAFAQSQTQTQPQTQYRQTQPQTQYPQTQFQSQGQPQTTGVAPANAPITTSDFVNHIAMSDMYDIQAAKLAEQKGDNSDKSFARGEVNEHTKLSDDLRNMVNAGKVRATFPTGLDNEHQQRLDRLAKLSGKQFDEAYSRDEAMNHRNLANMLQQYAQTGDNNDLKQWASKQLPEVQKRLTDAEKLK